MTPGRYLRLRREAAGMAIDCLVISPEALTEIESDKRAPTDMELTALGWAFEFDIEVLLAIARGVIPPVCRVCGCSEEYPCLTSDSYCAWVEEDLCSHCANARDAAA